MESELRMSNSVHVMRKHMQLFGARGLSTCGFTGQAMKKNKRARTTQKTKGKEVMSKSEYSPFIVSLSVGNQSTSVQKLFDATSGMTMHSIGKDGAGVVFEKIAEPPVHLIVVLDRTLSSVSVVYEKQISLKGNIDEPVESSDYLFTLTSFVVCETATSKRTSVCLKKRADGIEKDWYHFSGVDVVLISERDALSFFSGELSDCCVELLVYVDDDHLDEVVL
jgi:hypothetical protein